MVGVAAFGWQADTGETGGVEGRLSMVEHPELQPVLTVAGGPMRGARFRLRSGALVIGRAPTVDIAVDDPHLSRQHAVVRLTGELTTLNDLGSTNGTWLNDRRITDVEPLTDGDVIRVGRTELRFFDPGVARTDPVGLTFGVLRRHQRPTLPLPVATPPAHRAVAGDAGHRPAGDAGHRPAGDAGHRPAGDAGHRVSAVRQPVADSRAEP
ncbi:FHA domain-containing protein [Micromonospora sp. WMMD882]|uniref:FHA domain-containing protein n=1 Tax=Micromonospora sp. WMMD882 TaxID=3015151 RepID=UPI00248CED25|nr:FHA domain-containing protein [Micromonospora sp. WMMD882]WBB79487.1 FHA domain-containing protein [Micromonospora sp. WMMD882]